MMLPASGRFALRALLIACGMLIVSINACRSVRIEVAPAPGSAPVANGANGVFISLGAQPASEATRIAVATVSTPPPGPIQSVQGTIDKSGQKDTYRLDGKQGQLLQANVQRTSGISLKPALELVDPSGLTESSTQPVISFGGTDAFAHLERRLSSNGSYALLVKATDGQGPYSMAWSLDAFGVLLPGAELNAELAPGQRDHYHFLGRQGQNLDVRVIRSSGISLQPALELDDPTDVKEAEASSGQSETSLSHLLASTGVYTLVAYAHVGSGPYTIRLSLR